jgi:hypothetical protein
MSGEGDDPVALTPPRRSCCHEDHPFRILLVLSVLSDAAAPASALEAKDVFERQDRAKYRCFCSNEIAVAPAPRCRDGSHESFGRRRRIQTGAPSRCLL